MGKDKPRGVLQAKRPTSRDVAALAGVSRATVKRATGIYAFNDEQAIVALEVLRDHGVALPEEMALIGCDDSPAAGQMRPRLTTVRFDDHGRRREIARHLHAMISGDGDYPAMTASDPAVVAGQTKARAGTSAPDHRSGECLPGSLTIRRR